MVCLFVKTPETTTMTTSAESTSSGLSCDSVCLGLVIGLVLGFTLIAAIIVVVVVILAKKRRKQKLTGPHVKIFTVKPDDTCSNINPDHIVIGTRSSGSLPTDGVVYTPRSEKDNINKQLIASDYITVPVTMQEITV